MKNTDEIKKFLNKNRKFVFYLNEYAEKLQELMNIANSLSDLKESLPKLDPCSKFVLNVRDVNYDLNPDMVAGFEIGPDYADALKGITDKKLDEVVETIKRKKNDLNELIEELENE